jgi:hypothetical protein
MASAHSFVDNLRASARLFYCSAIVPGVADPFSREATRILAGEWWRLVTALFFQHGGLIGGLTNIATLFWIGDLAPASFYQIDACSARGLAAVEATARPVVVRLLLRTRIVPPCLSTIAFETERPSPVPRSFLVVK